MRRVRWPFPPACPCARSLAGMPSASITSCGNSRATASGWPTHFSHSAAADRQHGGRGQSLPPPSNTGAGHPGCMRRHLRSGAGAAPGGSDRSAPATSGPATNRRMRRWRLHLSGRRRPATGREGSLTRDCGLWRRPAPPAAWPRASQGHRVQPPRRARRGAVSIRPTGNSPAAWHGRLIEQPSRKLKAKVLRSNRPLAWKKASSDASRASMAGATMGTVGQITASKPSSRCSTLAIQSRRLSCMAMYCWAVTALAQARCAATRWSKAALAAWPGAGGAAQGLHRRETAGRIDLPISASSANGNSISWRQLPTAWTAASEGSADSRASSASSSTVCGTARRKPRKRLAGPARAHPRARHRPVRQFHARAMRTPCPAT